MNRIDNIHIIPPKKEITNKFHEYVAEILKTSTGGLVNPLIELMFPSFYQRKFEIWCESVSAKLIELDSKCNSINIDDYEFVSLLRQSAISVIRTHLDEKHKMLKCAIINSIKNDFSFEKKSMFLSLIDSLTLTHHAIFSILLNNFLEFRGLNKYEEIKKALIDCNNNLRISIEEVILVLNDLERCGLIYKSSDIENDAYVRTSVSITEGYENPDSPYIIVTEFGKEYYNFITTE